MASPAIPVVRRADIGDARAIAQLLHDFNREFDEATPPVDELADRISQLLRAGDTVVLLAGDVPDGLAVLRFRAALWSSGPRRRHDGDRRRRTGSCCAPSLREPRLHQSFG